MKTYAFYQIKKIKSFTCINKTKAEMCTHAQAYENYIDFSSYSLASYRDRLAIIIVEDFFFLHSLFFFFT